MRGGTRVLVVDDNEPTCMIIGKVLVDAGFTVECSHSAETALDRHAAHPYQIIITDIVMDGMSGLDLLRRVKAATPETQVIVMTLHDSVDRAIDAMSHGAFYYLTKPIKSLSLIEAVVARAEADLLQAQQDRNVLVELRQQQRRLIQDKLENLALGVLLVSGNGEVIATNGRANALITAGNFLTIKDNHATTARRRQDGPLKELLAEAENSDDSFSGHFSVEHRTGIEHLAVFVTPYRLPEALNLPAARCIALFFDASAAVESKLSVPALQALYSLTQAEVRLAVGLVQGIPLEEIAHNNNVSKNTVRVQLQALYRKTGTRRQHELAVRLLSVTSSTQALIGDRH